MLALSIGSVVISARYAYFSPQHLPSHSTHHLPSSVVPSSADTHSHRAGALASRRDVKKALQQLGRTRADILLLLSKPLLTKLASTDLPLPPTGHLDRKVSAALKRLQKGLAAAAAASGSSGAAAVGAAEDDEQQQEEEGAEAAAAAEVPVVALGKASTQDVLRLVWSIADDQGDIESGGEPQ
jgi:hypothetical protein